MIDIHDSEILRIEKVLSKLKSVSALPRNIDDFERRIVGEFADIGFRVEVKWYYTNAEGVYSPEIEIVERLEGEFDPDRQVHEVVNNVLNLPNQPEGFIPVGGKELEMIHTGKTEESRGK